MGDILANSKNPYWKASKVPLNTDFISNWEIEI